MKAQYLLDMQKQINEADLIVVGLGEEWNASLDVMEVSAYKRIMRDLQLRSDFQWLLPYFYYHFTDEKLISAYKTLFSMLEGRNYFIVATSVNRSFIPYAREGRFVMPCGTAEHMRDTSLSASSEYAVFMDSLVRYVKGEILFDDIRFVKDAEGKVIPFNNIYADAYNEEGYLPQWGRYMMWLQGTMNRKVCILELGAGLQFPSVIRFPFEKLTVINRKAHCFRVHQTLYHLTEEMAERSISVPMNAVELFSK